MPVPGRVWRPRQRRLGKPVPAGRQRLSSGMAATRSPRSFPVVILAYRPQDAAHVWAIDLQAVRLD